MSGYDLSTTKLSIMHLYHSHTARLLKSIGRLNTVNLVFVRTLE